MNGRSLRTQAIYIYGLHPKEASEDVKTFLENTVKVKVKSNFRWLTHSGTIVRNGGRSVIVEMQEGAEIPGYAIYQSPTAKPEKISIWYPQMAPYCKSCLQKGHLARDCEMPQQERPHLPRPGRSYANAVVASRNQTAVTSKIDDDVIQMDTLPKQAGVRKRTNTFENAEYWPFYTKTTYSQTFMNVALILTASVITLRNSTCSLSERIR